MIGTLVLLRHYGLENVCVCFLGTVFNVGLCQCFVLPKGCTVCSKDDLFEIWVTRRVLLGLVAPRGLCRNLWGGMVPHIVKTLALIYGVSVHNALCVHITQMVFVISVKPVCHNVS